ncbi:chymotrypsin BI-like [Convolutriloba macropyga]|uniref:chymotrypsin BI-like n=1 Tax=Convolutriloba macropyga TaxID=536237 RepID=UPI003F5259C5
MNEIDPLTNVTTYKLPEVLKEVKLYESTNETCKNESFTLYDSYICVNSTDGDPCYGDSGGPMYPFGPDDKPMCLYGVVSYSPEGNCNGWTVYTRVPYFRHWIQQKMDENY